MGKKKGKKGRGEERKSKPETKKKGIF